MERMKRWLNLTLTLVLVLVLVLSAVPTNVFGIAIEETVDIHFVPNSNWREADAWFAAYYWTGSAAGRWVKLTQDGLFYTGKITKGYSNIIFVRMDPAKTALNWDSKWSQTNDLTLDTSKPVFVLDGGWVQTGTWIAKPTSYDYYLAGYLDGVNVGIEGAENLTANKFVDGKMDVTFTADSYVCVGIQTGTTILGNYMAQSYVDNSETATMYIDGGEKLFVPAGTYRFALIHNYDGSVTLRYGCPHSMTYHEAVGATCTDDGNVAYYACSVCGKNFSDEAGTAELANIIINSQGHSLVFGAGYEASCSAGGVADHYHCYVCSKNFADEAGTVELTSEEVLIPPTGVHNYVNGFCALNSDGAICDSREPAVLVTADNCAELGLSESYIGYYAITNAGNLYWFAEKVNSSYSNTTANAVLTDNITVNEGTVTAESTGLRTWRSIGSASEHYSNGPMLPDDYPYSGTFDGNGKTISGLYGGDGNYFGGFIGNLGESGRVQNLTISNSHFCGGARTWHAIGCIVGWNRGNVTGCFNTATAGGSAYVGGIVGLNTGIVERCGNSGYLFNVTDAAVGGIIGHNAGIVRNCWNTGTIDAYNNNAGGIVGKQVPSVRVYEMDGDYTYSDVRTENCWSVCELFCGNNGTGAGIVGYIEGETVVDNCYSDWDTLVWQTNTDNGTPTVTDVEQKTAEQFASGEVAYLLQKDQATQVWGQNIDNGKTVQTVPVFSDAKVYYGYIICTDTEETYTNNVMPSHDWSYTASGAEITAACSNGCGNDGGKATLVFNGSVICDGSEKTVDVTGALTGIDTLPAVTYEGDRINAGTFTAYLTLTDGTKAELKVTIIDLEEIMKPLEDVTAENVTSDELDTIEDVREALEGALESTGLTDEQRQTIEDALDELDELEQRVDDARNAVIDESVNDTLDVTDENVTPEDKEDLEKAKDVLEDALDEFGGNYTDEEKETIEDAIERIEDALEALDNVKAVEDMIAALPETVETDDEETAAAIEDAKDAYDALTDHEKELVSEEAKEKLDKLVEAMSAYKIIKGDGASWSKGADKTLDFTANGPYGKFVGVEIDGKSLDTKHYTSASGSTIIKLKVSYLEGLTVGTHTIKILYTDGAAAGSFTIAPKAESPATGDTANVALWSSIALISLAAAAALVLGKKRFSV